MKSTHLSNQNNSSKVIIGDDVTVIEAEQFQECKHMKRVSLPEGLVCIEQSAFLRFFSLRELNLPSSLAEIGPHAFEKCFKLKKITFSDGLKKIGHSAFEGCNSLRIIILPEGLETIGSGVFSTIPLLKELRFPKTLKHIGSNIFCRSRLCYLRFPARIQPDICIDKDTFGGCVGIQKIDLPKDDKSAEMIWEKLTLGLQDQLLSNLFRRSFIAFSLCQLRLTSAQAVETSPSKKRTTQLRPYLSIYNVKMIMKIIYSYSLSASNNTEKPWLYFQPQNCNGAQSEPDTGSMAPSL